MLQTQPRAGDSANPRQWLARAATLHGIVEGVAHREAQPTGVEALDAWLPLGGLPKGALTEIVTNASPSANHEGSLATSLLLLPLLAKLTQAGERVAVIDYAGNLYPPALKGVVLENLLLIRPRRRSDALWAFQQCARSPALALTWAGLPRLDQHQARTLSLAAEAGGGVCVALRRRGEGAAGAALRLKVNPAPARSWHEASAKLELLRSKPAVRREALELRLFEGRTSGQSPNTQTQRGWA